MGENVQRLLKEPEKELFEVIVKETIAFAPALALMTFKSVLDELQVPYVVSDYEADHDVAVLSFY